MQGTTKDITFTLLLVNATKPIKERQLDRVALLVKDPSRANSATFKIHSFAKPPTTLP